MPFSIGSPGNASLSAFCLLVFSVERTAVTRECALVAAAVTREFALVPAAAAPTLGFGFGSARDALFACSGKESDFGVCTRGPPFPFETLVDADADGLGLELGLLSFGFGNGKRASDEGDADRGFFGLDAASVSTLSGGARLRARCMSPDVPMLVRLADDDD